MNYDTTRVSVLMRRDSFGGRTISVHARKLQKQGYKLIDRLTQIVTHWSVMAVIVMMGLHATATV